MAFVSQQRRQADPDADAAVNLLEVPVDVLLDSLRARPDVFIVILYNTFIFVPHMLRTKNWTATRRLPPPASI
jgi:hypothetical protein